MRDNGGWEKTIDIGNTLEKKDTIRIKAFFFSNAGNPSHEDGVASADFSSALEQGVGGSCRVASIRAQITETLKQFATVREVIISINGRTEDILQP